MIGQLLWSRAAAVARTRSAPLASRVFSPPTLATLLGHQHRQYATRIVVPANGQPPNGPDGKPLTLLDIDATAAKQLNAIANGQALRILVEAGGCHGFQYKLDLVDAGQIQEDDVMLENNGAKVIIDTTSLELVAGSRVVFADELIGQEFRVVDIPNAGSSCGCGTSFEVKF
ncbi:hypothetical protein BC828DRAFT_383286 [Blastocladiella britannica]|nr:hypothetical protein BC828DRAFT_383286 [Blastocladiella britannica]